ncbi:restriction endonuclease subunit M [Lelliottia sp. WB101]|uniref:DNA adenine methylase n=1 Tax=Lelliottia sp. WB101 TaxID=2153385 RepID=UPI000D2207A5|nr:DNA adenine methylase [Lelliottia sp. WB101]AVY99409.1 restriction endonuclease subunit M [Lelliottia sp. WB101]
MGGKSRLAKAILPAFPEHTCYVEPFCGGAALFFRKEPSKVEVLNDINGELVNLYRVVKHHLEEFVRQFKWALTSRQIFEWNKATDPETLTDIQRAARFYYQQRLEFGAKVGGNTFGTSATKFHGLNLLRLEETLSEAHLRLSDAVIEHLAWDICLKRYDRPETLFYLDPPYYGTAGYGVDFPLGEYSKMATLAKEAKGKVIISLGDSELMRETFSGLHITALSAGYSLGSNKQKARELLVSNFEIE